MRNFNFFLLLAFMAVANCMWAADAGIPTLTVHPETLRFQCEAGRSFYRTFTVSGTNLTEDLTLTMFGDVRTFSMDRTTITAEEAMAGVEVRVLYKPQAVGEYGARIWIESSEVSNSVLLTGIADDLPSITSSTTSLTMNCIVGETATGTFTVSGDNLEEGIHLVLEDPSGAFSIDKSEISLYDAYKETTITVTYQPSKAGVDTANILVWSHYSNDVIISLCGNARTPYLNHDYVLVADVFDVVDDEGASGSTVVPATPSGCGRLVNGVERYGSLWLDLFYDLFRIDIDENNKTVTLYDNATQEAVTETSFNNKVTTETHYFLMNEATLDDPYLQDNITGWINEDGSIGFDGFVVMTEQIVTVSNPFTNQVISTEITCHKNLYRNVLLVEPNGTHRYKPTEQPDPGTAEPMLNSMSFTHIVPVYIVQHEDTVMVWNLYNMGGCNKMVLDNGFFDWQMQPCGYNEDGGCWYNYTFYRSYTPPSEPMISVVTYPNRLPGVKGKATDEAITWGKTTFGDGNGQWSQNVFGENVLSYGNTMMFECEMTVWTIADVTKLIDGILNDDIETLVNPASDMNDDELVNVTDISLLIDRLLHQNIR